MNFNLIGISLAINNYFSQLNNSHNQSKCQELITQLIMNTNCLYNNNNNNINKQHNDDYSYSEFAIILTPETNFFYPSVQESLGEGICKNLNEIKEKISPVLIKIGKININKEKVLLNKEIIEDFMSAYGLCNRMQENLNVLGKILYAQPITISSLEEKQTIYAQTIYMQRFYDPDDSINPLLKIILIQNLSKLREKLLDISKQIENEINNKNHTQINMGKFKEMKKIIERL